MSKLRENSNRKNEIEDEKREPEGPGPVQENPGRLQHIKRVEQVSKHPGKPPGGRYCSGIKDSLILITTPLP